MKNNNFKSAEHAVNYANLILRKKNGKQPVKIYTEEEKRELAKRLGIGTVPSKPIVGTIKVREEKPVDLSVLPAELVKKLGLSK